MGEGAKKLLELRSKWAALVGEFTFDDIVRELEKPGRDPRDPFKVFSFRDDIFDVKDLKENMICPGIVTNVTNFGAFVDIGVHQDGLVHISMLSHKFVDDPRKVVNPGDQVTVKVIGVDLDKNQISLSMLLDEAPKREARPPQEKREGAPRGQGGARPHGDRGPRPQHGGGDRGQRPQMSGQGQGGRPQEQRGGGGRGGPPQRQSSPFNNPFAALLGNQPGGDKRDRK
jgi:uncharacterized protein